MRFWDTSAVVPLIADERSSGPCRRLYRQDSRMVVWLMTATEALSGLCRHLRLGLVTPTQFLEAKGRLARLMTRWREVASVNSVRERADRVLHEHPLRAADALQLGAALIYVRNRPSGHAFITRDGDLAEAARRERFQVIQPIT